MSSCFTGHMALCETFLKCLPFQNHDMIILTWVSNEHQIWVQYILHALDRLHQVCWCVHFYLLVYGAPHLAQPSCTLKTKQHTTLLDVLSYWIWSDLNTSPKVSFFTSTYLLICLTYSYTWTTKKNGITMLWDSFFWSLPNLGSEYLPAVGSTFIIKFDVCVHFDYLILLSCISIQLMSLVLVDFLKY